MKLENGSNCVQKSSFLRSPISFILSLCFISVFIWGPRLEAIEPVGVEMAPYGTTIQPGWIGHEDFDADMRDYCNWWGLGGSDIFYDTRSGFIQMVESYPGQVFTLGWYMSSHPDIWDTHDLFVGGLSFWADDPSWTEPDFSSQDAAYATEQAEWEAEVAARDAAMAQQIAEEAAAVANAQLQEKINTSLANGHAVRLKFPDGSTRMLLPSQVPADAKTQIVAGQNGELTLQYTSLSASTAALVAALPDQLAATAAANIPTMPLPFYSDSTIEESVAGAYLTSDAFQLSLFELLSGVVLSIGLGENESEEVYGTIQLAEFVVNSDESPYFGSGGAHATNTGEYVRLTAYSLPTSEQSFFSGPGYMDEFGQIHPTFCLSCHDTTPQALFYKQQAVLANMLDYQVILYQEVLGFVLGLVAGGIADIATLQQMRQLAVLTRTNLGGGVGELFEAARLERVIEGLSRNGVTIVRGTAAEGMLQQQGAGALYFSYGDGQAGMLFIRQNPTRSELIEEIVHFVQDRNRGFAPAANLGEAAVRRATDEIAAQHLMINLARHAGWSTAEVQQFERNLATWIRELQKAKAAVLSP